MGAISGMYIRGSTRHLPERRDYEYFCDAVSDVYVGVRPDRPNGPYAADFALYDLGSTRCGYLEAPGTPARRDRSAIAQVPDEALFLNFSRSAWTIDHLGRSHAVSPGTPFLIDNGESFLINFDPKRRMQLYSLRIPRELLETVDVRRVDERIGPTPEGQHLATQTALMAAMLDAGRLDIASTMSDSILGLLDVVGSSVVSTPSADRLTDFKRVARMHLTDPSFGVGELAHASLCSLRTVQLAFAAAGETASGWLTAERLELARSRLSSPEWAGHSVARVAAASGFIDVSSFYKAFRMRFGTTPGAVR